jgi:DNA-binding NarL/FixJ family response regulator
MESIRVLIVEDHNVVRQGLVALLNVVDGLTVVGEAADGLEAIDQFRKHQPDVTLMDLRLPRMGGVEAIQRIRVEAPQARIIVLTTYDGDEDIYRALKAGARAYLLKTW